MEQPTANIQLPDNKNLRLIQLNSGDILGSVSETFDGRLREIILFTIPKNRRDIVARFIGE